MVCLAVAAALPQSPRAVGEKPVAVTRRHAENRALFESVSAMWAVAHVVVEGMVESAELLQIPRPAVTPIPLIQTQFTIRAIEVFKADARIRTSGDRFLIRKSGGDVDRGTHIERIELDDFPIYRIGERYVLFLRQHIPHEQPIFYSPESISGEGVFLMGESSIQPRGRQLLARRLADSGPDAFRKALREESSRPR